jgi:hypothetical protein
VAAVTAPAVAGGLVRGDEARVEVAGGWTEERRCSGSVHLRRDGGKWRVARSGLAGLRVSRRQEQRAGAGEERTPGALSAPGV